MKSVFLISGSEGIRNTVGVSCEDWGWKKALEEPTTKTVDFVQQAYNADSEGWEENTQRKVEQQKACTTRQHEK